MKHASFCRAFFNAATGPTPFGASFLPHFAFLAYTPQIVCPNTITPAKKLQLYKLFSPGLLL